MSGTWRANICMIILLPLYMGVQAQGVVNEYETWTVFSMDKKITNRLKVKLAPEV